MKYFNLLFFFLFVVGTLHAQDIKNFTLHSVTDSSSLTLTSLKGKFVALHFLLKTECPFCIRFTNEYNEKSASLLNVTQVFIKPDGEKEIREWMGKLKNDSSLKIQIYQDLDGKLADEFNVPSGYFFHGQMVHYPALILLNEAGKEVFRYIGKNNSDRFSFDKLELKMKELTNSK